MTPTVVDVAPRPSLLESSMLALLDAIPHDPDPSLPLVLADWLEEHDDPRRAELVRLHQRLLTTCTEPDKHRGRAEWQARIVALLGDGVRPVVPRRTIALAANVDMSFAWIPPGNFLMGSPEGEAGRDSDETLRQVALPRGFWLAVHPVTQTQWRAVMGYDPSRFKVGNPSHFKFKGDQLPVETVSWGDCRQFAEKLGRRIGAGVRLPSEAEWEYACRAGTTTPFFFGETLQPGWANFLKDGLRQTSPVGSYPPNAWGLHDMHGNVWECCADRYGESSYRVFRGGSWASSSSLCRAAYRSRFAPVSRYSHLGLRVCFRLE